MVSGRALIGMPTAAPAPREKAPSTSPGSASFLSARQHGRFPKVRILIDLLDQEVGDIGARDETDAP
jgi:hypothetical protein